MISSFSCESALAAIRGRWCLSRAKKNAADTQVGDQAPRLQLPISDFYMSNERCQPTDVWNNSFYKAISRDETFEDVELGAPCEAQERHRPSKNIVEHPVEPVMYDYCSSRTRSEAPSTPTDTPLSTPSRSFEIEEPSPKTVKLVPFIDDCMTAEPEALSTSSPSETVYYTPGGRVIPAIPYSMCKAPTRLSLSYPVRPAKSLDEPRGNQRDSYTRITPPSASQTPKRSRSRYSRAKASSMASTPISEDDELPPLPLHTSESSSSTSTLADSDEGAKSSDRTGSTSTDGSADRKCDRSTSNNPASASSDVPSEESRTQGPRRAEYVEDTQLLSVRRQQLKSQRRQGPPSTKDTGYRQPNPGQARGFTYPPPLPVSVNTREALAPGSTANLDMSQTHPAYRNTRHQSFNEIQVPPAASGTRRVPNNYSLHQRTMLSQWRANLAAESAKQSVDSPWTAQGGDVIAAGEAMGAVPATTKTREPWRERQTKNGCAGWGSRGEARMLSGMGAREIELAHREVLRRMQAGANRRLEMSLVM